MGLAYIQQGDIERGLQCCDEALALAPILPRDAALAKVGRGYGQIKAGRFEAGFAELREALAWQDRSGFRFTYLSFALFLAEGYLRRGDTASARPLIQDLLEGSKANGYTQIEGRACWLMAECLAGGGSPAAEGYIERAIQIFERIGARSDLAKATLTQRPCARGMATQRRPASSSNAPQLCSANLPLLTSPPASKRLLPCLTAVRPSRYSLGRDAGHHRKPARRLPQIGFHFREMAIICGCVSQFTRPMPQPG